MSKFLVTSEIRSLIFIEETLPVVI